MVQPIPVPSQNARNFVDHSYRQGRIPDEAYQVMTQGDLINNVVVFEDDWPEQDAILLAIMPDDSASITAYGNIEKVIESHNRVFEAIEELCQQPSHADIRRRIRVRTEYLNGYILNNWVRLENAARLSETNFIADKITPLWDRTVELIMSVMVQQEICRRSGDDNSRIALLIMSDGEEEHSRRYTDKDVRHMVDALRRRSNPLRPDTIAFLGVPGINVDFRRTANEMGIRDEFKGEGKRQEIIHRVLTPEDSLVQIRHAIDLFSQSVI
jgi:hypothetical protein